MKKYALIIAACTLTLGAAAQTQNLTKEITVEKDYVPVERKATKQNELPTVQKNAANMNAKLDYSDWNVPSAVPAKIPTMMPYGFMTNKEFSDKKGYFDLGAGTQLNIVGSAGYRIIDEKTQTLGIWLQHNSTWLGKNTSPHSEDYEPSKQKYNDNMLGADFKSEFYEGTLDINMRFNYDNFNYYGVNNGKMFGATPYRNPFGSDVMGNQTFTQFGASGSWQSRRNERDFVYYGNLSLGRGGFKKNNFDTFKALNEISATVKAGGEYDLREDAAVGADFMFDFAHYNDDPMLDLNAWKLLRQNNKNISIVSIAPFARVKSENFILQFGAKLDFTFNSGSKFRLSPNLKFDYSLHPSAGIYVDLTGGNAINNFWKMHQANRYFCPGLRYGTSYTPIDLEAGLNLGGFAGFTAKLFGGYGAYRDYQMPYRMAAPAIPSATGYDICLEDLQSATFYHPLNISGWKAGAEIGYKYRSIIDTKVRFVYSPQDNKTGYILGQDRPEYTVDASLRVMPTTKLAIAIGYEMRGNRAVYSKQILNGIDYWESYDLGNMMDLNVGVSYEFVDNVTFFVQGNNLTNKQWDMFYNLGAQKLNVIGGVNILF